MKESIILVLLFFSTIAQAQIDSIQFIGATADSLVFTVHSTESDEILKEHVEYEDDMSTIKINVLYSMGWHQLDCYCPIETIIKIKKDTYSKAIVSLKTRYPIGGPEENPEYPDDYLLRDSKDIDLANIINIDNPTVSNEFLIYPNPTQNVFHVNLRESKMANLEIYDVQGHLLLCENITPEKGIDISFLPSGLYFVLIDRKYIGNVIKE